MKERIKNKLPLIAAFIVPLVIAIGVCAKRDIYPFGDNCMLHMDMFHQYCPFFYELMDKLRHGGSFFYSWRIGLGADFLGLYAYYLSSPLNWLILLCPQQYVIELMSVLILFKIAFSGFSFAYYMKEHYKTNTPLLAVLGSAYALCAFTAAYSWDIMWMDCMALAPLIILGLEKLVKEGKVRLYYITLAISIVSNYYISILICIFLVLWFLITWLENRESGVLAWARFGVYSALAGGTGALLIIPEAIILGASGSQNISFPDTMEWYFNLVDELARHAIFTETHNGTGHWPNIYCGVFVCVLVLLYFLHGKISWKQKAPRLVLLLLFVLGFSNNKLDFIWHGLHFPDSLPARQTFLYAFLLLVLSYEALVRIKESKLWHLVLVAVVNAIFWYEAYTRMNTEFMTEKTFYATGLLLAGYLLLLLVAMLGQKKIPVIMLALGGATALVELTLNMADTGFGTIYRPSYVARMDEYDLLIEDAALDNEADGGGFYRMEELERKTKNDSNLYGYPSLTQFSSLMNLDVSHFYQRVGMEGGKNYYCSNGTTPLMSAMLSLKYVLADNSLEEGPLLSLVGTEGESYLYENRYSLPLGFVMNEDVIAQWEASETENKMDIQNELATLLGAAEPMFTQVSSIDDEGMTTVQIEEDAYYYARYDSTSIDKLSLETSDGRTRDYSKVSHNYTLDLGYCRAGSTVWIKNTENEILPMTVYRMSLPALEAAYRTLSSQTMDLTKLTDTTVEGDITVTSPGRLIFSIANEKGWKLYVDGEPVEPESFGDAFLSVYLDEGDYEIRLKYRTPGFVPGLFVTILCLLAFVLLEIWSVKYRKDLVALATEKVCAFWEKYVWKNKKSTRRNKKQVPKKYRK